MPVTVTQATNNNAFAGFALQRPNIVGQDLSAPEQRTPAKFFNTAAFSDGSAVYVGQCFTEPGAWTGLSRSGFCAGEAYFAGGEGAVELRAEVFDVTNTPAFAQPNGSFGSAAFGSITSTTTDPRVVQFALRISR